MGFSKEREEQQLKRDERAKAFEKFRGLIEQLQPEWALRFDDSVTLTATCQYGQETLNFTINYRSGSITDTGDLNPGLSGYESVDFSIRSPSVQMFLLMEGWNRVDFAYAWNQAAFDWLANYGQNSAPLIALRERRLKLKKGLGF